MSNKVVLFADSTCDLGNELIESLGVNICQYHIVLNGKDYLDNVTITSDEIFDEYYKTKTLPKTTCINAQEYIDRFKPWVDKGYDVVHINLSSSISSSNQNANIAASELENVYVIDSKNLSTGTGHLVIEAAKMIADGKSGKEIADELNAMVPKVHTSFILDTLEFMKAGGRCSATAAFGANLLKIKPCIEMDNSIGTMSVGKKYRGSLETVLVQYVNDKLAQYDNIRTDKIFVTYSAMDIKTVEMVKKTVKEIMPFENVYCTRAACTIASHCGPECLGILFMTE